jgi:DNA-binding NtrC family response regulator
MGTIPASLFESELFGHVKGAFTDAHADKPGKFEQADGGTLFLDEIGNLSYALQAKMLTALQNRTVTRVGGRSEIRFDIRLITATNRNVESMVAEQTFRQDLFYRINTIALHLPPLRERAADIVPLAEMFLSRYASAYGRPVPALTPDAAQKLTAYPWPGNIRQLQHTMERTLILTDGVEICAAHLQLPTASAVAPSVQGVQTLEDVERETIARAVAECEGNMSAVAQRLGITRQTLYNKIKKYGI